MKNHLRYVVAGLFLSLAAAIWVSPLVILYAKYTILAPLAVMGGVTLGTFEISNLSDIETLLASNTGAIASVVGALMLALFAQSWYRLTGIVKSCVEKNLSDGIDALAGTFTPLITFFLWSLCILQYYLVVFKVIITPIFLLTGGALLLSGTDYMSIVKTHVSLFTVLLVIHFALLAYTYTKVYAVILGILKFCFSVTGRTYKTPNREEVTEENLRWKKRFALFPQAIAENDDGSKEMIRFRFYETRCPLPTVPSARYEYRLPGSPKIYAQDESNW